MRIVKYKKRKINENPGKCEVHMSIPKLTLSFPPEEWSFNASIVATTVYSTTFHTDHMENRFTSLTTILTQNLSEDNSKSNNACTLS